MRVKEKDHQLILTDNTGCVWLFSSLFVFVGGTFVYGSMGGFSNYREVAPWVLLVSGAMGLIGLATGLGIIHATPFTTTTLNRSSRTLLISWRGLLGNSERLIRFSEIAEFHVVHERDSDGDSVYRVDMRLKTSEDIRLSAVMNPAL